MWLIPRAPSSPIPVRTTPMKLMLGLGLSDFIVTSIAGRTKLTFSPSTNFISRLLTSSMCTRLGARYINPFCSRSPSLASLISMLASLPISSLTDSLTYMGMCWTMRIPASRTGKLVSNLRKVSGPPVDAPITIIFLILIMKPLSCE